jgi:tetratricopeptide (TPR) repeat protein
MFLPLFPQNDDLQKGLALTLLEMGEYSKGIAILQQVLRKNPSDTEILLTLGSTYQTLADFKNARLTYIHLLKLDAFDLEARENLVQCYLREENYPKALAELEDWKEAFLKINRLERLQEFYEILLSALPGNLQVLQTLDSIYEITGDGDKLLDMVSGGDEAGAFNAMRVNLVEETLSDSLLGDMNVEDDSLTFDTSDLLGESMLIDLPSQEDELELEPLEEVEEAEEEEEFIELNLNDAPEIDKGDSFDDMDLDFVLEEAPEVPAADAGADLEEAEFYLQQGLFDEAEKVCTLVLERIPDSVEATAKLQEIGLRRGSSKESAEQSQNLATELLDESFPELDGETDVVAAEAQFENFAEESPVVEVAGVRKVFRTDVDEQIAADDMESHYNLGIAYREMGLFSDAIAEFTKAEKDQTRFVDCQTLKGLCWVDQGDFAKGESSFRAALEGESLAVGQQLSLYYELGALYENWQRPLDALESFKRVADSDLFFRDVADRLDRLRKSLDLTEKTDAPQTSTAESKDRISFL